MGIELLLKEVSLISEKYDYLNRKTGGYFNIFEIANISTNEVTICRLIHELLSPRGSHFQGILFLKLFFEHVLHLEIEPEEMQTAAVYREYTIDANRRIDLAIATSVRFIPIEVKIYASDQKLQCVDYYKRSKNSNVYYLTLFGDPPSKESGHGLTEIENGYSEVTNISFSNDIIQWIEKCLEQKETIRIAPIREVLLQFLSVIHKLTNKLGEGKEMEIKQLIMSSSANMKSAVEIQQSLKECKIQMMFYILKEIEKRLGKEKLFNEYDYENDDGKLVKTYYDRNSPTYPGISYLYKKDVKKNTDIWFRIEIEYNLFCGFCVPVNSQSGKQALSDKEIRIQIPHVEPCIENWWTYWEYLPVDDGNCVPNFKSMDSNDPYYLLYDSTYLNGFIDNSIKRIKEVWK